MGCIFSQPKPQDNDLADFYKHMNSLMSANYQRHENTDSDNDDDLDTAQVEKKGKAKKGSLQTVNEEKETEENQEDGPFNEEQRLLPNQHDTLARHSHQG
jgi:hypothetical protein